MPGTPESAPTSPRLLRLFLINTLVAAIVFAIVWALVRYQVLPLAALMRSPG